MNTSFFLMSSILPALCPQIYSSIYLSVKFWKGKWLLCYVKIITVLTKLVRWFTSIPYWNPTCSRFSEIYSHFTLTTWNFLKFIKQLHERHWLRISFKLIHLHFSKSEANSCVIHFMLITSQCISGKICMTLNSKYCFEKQGLRNKQ